MSRTTRPTVADASGFGTVNPRDWARFLGASTPGLIRVGKFDSFSGCDLRVVLYMPPNPEELDESRKYGYFQEFETLQTITVSSHRPAAMARRLGSAAALPVRTVRTFAGTIIFNRTDLDPFIEAYGRCEMERQDIVPSFVDQVPPFHVYLHGQNEFGALATAGIVGITLTDFGTAFTVEDLVPDVTYSYVAQWVRPFGDMGKWRNELENTISWLSRGTGSGVSSLALPADKGARNVGAAKNEALNADWKSYIFELR